MDHQPQPTPADQALRHLTAAAADSDTLATSTWSGSPSTSYHTNYKNGIAALRDAQVGIGQALIAIHEELAGTRDELSEITAAIRELTAAVIKTAKPQADDQTHDITAAITEIAAATSEGLGDIASAVDSLPDRMLEPPRPSWRDRLLRRRSNTPSENTPPA